MPDRAHLIPRVDVDEVEAPKKFVVTMHVRSPRTMTAIAIANLLSEFVNEDTALDAVECEVVQVGE